MNPYFLILISLLLSLTTACQEKSQSIEVEGEYNLPSKGSGDLFGRVNINHLKLKNGLRKEYVKIEVKAS